MGRALALLVVAMGCKGFFDPHGGNWGPDSTTSATPAIVNMRFATGSTGTMSTAPLAIGAGDLIAIAVTSDDKGVTVDSVTDSLGNAYESVGARPISILHAAELWYAANASPGTTTVTVVTGLMSPANMWLLDVSGMNTSVPLDAVASNTVATSDAMGASVTTTVPNELVLVAIAVDGDAVTGLAPGNPFVELPASAGEAAAYFFAATPGTYTPTWMTANGGAPAPCSIGASFKPAP
jgi:hypothetical protein